MLGSPSAWVGRRRCLGIRFQSFVMRFVRASSDAEAYRRRRRSARKAALQRHRIEYARRIGRGAAFGAAHCSASFIAASSADTAGENEVMMLSNRCSGNGSRPKRCAIRPRRRMRSMPVDGNGASMPCLSPRQLISRRQYSWHATTNLMAAQKWFASGTAFYRCSISSRRLFGR